jgi:hypothetical protein
MKHDKQQLEKIAVGMISFPWFTSLPNKILIADILSFVKIEGSNKADKSLV